MIKALCSVRSVLAPSNFLFLVVRPGARLVASDRSVRSDALCSVRSVLVSPKGLGLESLGTLRRSWLTTLEPRPKEDHPRKSLA